MDPKNSLTSVQANSAVKVLKPVTNLKNVIDTKDKDGDESLSETMSIDVQVALNGYFVTISYSDLDTPDERYVLSTSDEVLELMRKKL